MDNKKIDEGKCEPLPMRQRHKFNSLGLNKRAVIVLVSGVSLLIAFVILSAFSPSRKDEALAKETNISPYPSDKVNGLPDDYSKIKRPAPKLEKVSLEGELLPLDEQKETLEEKFYKEYAMKKLRRTIEARESGLEFSSLKLKTESPLMLHTSAGQGGSELQGSGATSGASVEGQAQNGRDEANRQDEKNEYLKERRKDGTVLNSSLVGVVSKYALQAGAIIPGLLLTGINSDLPGQISGQISQNVYDTVTGRYLLLPQGTKVIGEYDSRVVYGQERVLVVWTRVILPNGDSINLEGMPGVDLSGNAGLTDQVNNHYLKLITGVLFGSVLGAGAQVAHGNQRYGNPDFGQLAISGAADNINQAGQEITRKNLNIQPTLEIRPGFRFNIFVTKDMVLKPYLAM